MEFSGQYLSYEIYRGLGGTLNLPSFNLLEFESRKKIDERTQNRLKSVDIIPSEVKICIFNLISKIDKYAESLDNVSTVASENTDGYSVTYITPTQIKEIMSSKSEELNDIIETDLFGVIVNDEHLLYLGVKQC